MLRSLKNLYGNKLGATDGEIGHIKDFYFDDKNWVVRYLVVDTNNWLPGRQVLISPHSVTRLDASHDVLRVTLSKSQIEKAPSIDTHKPVSRQFEEEYYRYYGWPCYWQGDGLWGMSGFPVMPLPGDIPQPTTGKAPAVKRSDAHLRSTLAVHDYVLRHGSNDIGQVSDFMLDLKSWTIDQLVIKIGHLLSSKEVLLPASSVENISYNDSAVMTHLTREAVEKSPAHH